MTSMTDLPSVVLPEKSLVDEKTLIDSYMNKSEELKNGLNYLRDVMRHSMQFRQKKMAKDWPLNGLVLGNRIVRENFEEYGKLHDRIEKEVTTQRLINNVKSEHGIINKILNSFHSRMTDHALQLGRNEEFEFLNLDFLTDPSDAAFDWKKEEAIELLMTSKFNMERRRQRRAKEGSEFEKVQLLIGLMDQEHKTILSTFIKVKDHLLETKKILMELNRINDKKMTQSSQEDVLYAIDCLQSLPSIFELLNKVYETSLEFDRKNIFFKSAIDYYIFDIDFIMERLKKIVEKCKKQAPLSTVNLHSFRLSFSLNHGGFRFRFV